jgi:hypothetical protein
VFDCQVTAETFLSWQAGELRLFRLGTIHPAVPGFLKRTTWKQYRILAPYDRIIAQLAAESDHGHNHASHEARRREEYANRVLDLFAKEVESLPGEAVTFYPKTLTPILVRQLRGVHDDISRTIRAVVARGSEEVTIQQATEFYLTMDPANPTYIRLYRRQLLNLPIVRWHLATILGIIHPNHKEHYDRFYTDHALIMHSLDVEDPYPNLDEDGYPLLNRVEVGALVAEGLEEYFELELAFVVCVTFGAQRFNI